MHKTRIATMTLGSISILFFFSIFFPGCNNSDSSSSDAGDSPTVLQPCVDYKNSPEQPAGSLSDDEQFILDNNCFAWDLYHEIRNDEEDSFFISPYSVSTALAMVWAGARGDTEAQMAGALCFSFSQEEIHSMFKDLIASLNSKGVDNPEEFRLYTTNALWGQEGYSFEQDYLDLIAENYGSGQVRQLDFIAEPELSRITINEWVEEQTENLIMDLLPMGSITPNSRLVLTNTIYFYGDWLYPFDSSRTNTKDFHLLEGGTVPVDMMHDTGYYSYVETCNYQAVELLYKDNQTSMMIVLPTEGVFYEIEGSMDTRLFDAITDNMAGNRVFLSLPKFSFGNSYGLAEYMQNLGMIDAFFLGQSDFSGITGDRSLFINKILHKTFVQMDEEGTEAAAATAVGMETSTGVEPPIPMRMNVNRPFIFAILDKETGAILFMGRVMDPAAS